MNKSKALIELITSGKDLRISTLEIAKHILSGSKQKTIGEVNKSLVRIIKRYQVGFEELGKIGFESLFNTSGKSTEYVELNEPQTNLLFMSMRNSNPLVWQFKVALASSFHEMKMFIIQRHNAEWINYRESGKIITKHLTEVFNSALLLSGKTQDRYQFINLQQTIYKATLGKTCQALRKERNIPKHCIIRDYLNPKELERVSTLQSIAEIILHKHEHVTNDMVINAINQAGNMLQLASNCMVIANHKEVA